MQPKTTSPGKYLKQKHETPRLSASLNPQPGLNSISFFSHHFDRFVPRRA